MLQHKISWQLTVLFCFVAAVLLIPAPPALGVRAPQATGWVVAWSALQNCSS